MNQADEYSVEDSTRLAVACSSSHKQIEFHIGLVGQYLENHLYRTHSTPV